MDIDLTLLRSIEAWESQHGRGQYYVQTAHQHNPALAPEIPPVGAVVATEYAARRRPTDSLPPYVAFNTFPLMGDRWIPEGMFGARPLWTNVFENTVTVQFGHRLLAGVLSLLVFLLWWQLSRRWRPAATRAAAEEGALLKASTPARTRSRRPLGATTGVPPKAAG